MRKDSPPPSLLGEVWAENEVERTGKAEANKLEALAAGKACYAKLYSYSTPGLI